MFFFSFARLSHFQIILFVFVFGIGALVGSEIPLLMRILKDNLDFKELVSRVLTFDYVGALAASLLFPIFFVPRLGLARTSLLFGLLNAAVGLWGTWLLKPLISGKVIGLRTRAALTIALLLACLLAANRLTRLAEDNLYGDSIVYARSTPHQRIVVTWLERSEEAFDAAIIDFPDPNNFSLGKLYTTRFYRLLQSRLAPDAAVAVQRTSPLFARQSYWRILRTMESAGFTVKPYHTPVPSFGLWGTEFSTNWQSP